MANQENTANDSSGIWQLASSDNQSPKIPVNRFKLYTLNRDSLENSLTTAPKESAEQITQATPIVLNLPTPNGGFARFQVVESSIMAPELAAKFPQIKTYRGQGLDDPSATVRFDVTPAGFHAQVLSPNGTYYVDPQDNNLYISYFKRDISSKPQVNFEQGNIVQNPVPSSGSTANKSSLVVAGKQSIGTELRTYDLAVAATGEYTQFFGGTVPQGLAAIVTAINRVTGIYETELSVRLRLVGNNNLLIYTNPGTDPYTNSDPIALLTENQTNIDAVIGDANYDIGHVFSTAGGGLAGLGVVGVSGQKARGETGTSSPTGDPFYVDYVAHELGHQFGANHTFNGVNGSTAGNVNTSTAYEPGSGSTIMAYAGISLGDDLQLNSDPYFHFASFNEITDLITTGVADTAATKTPTGNTIPTISAGSNYTIPARTPFALTATGSDGNGDTLTYAWEERDLGPTQGLPLSDNGSSPIFRSFSPTTSPTRFFPRLTDILNNGNVPTPIGGVANAGELLPTTNRTLNFRVTARDNRSGGGGVNSADMQVTVVNTGAPFKVTSPDTALTWTGGSGQTVTWNPAGTTANPINASSVSILLSTDGGLTFPTVLLANTPNDGSESVTAPNLSTSTARIKVQPVGNIFFDVSDSNFTINSSSSSFPDLTVTKSDSPDPVTAGGNLTYTIVASNNGSVNATGVIKIVDTLPAGFTFTSADVGSTGFTSTQTGNTVTFTGNALNASQSATFTITGTAPSTAGTITNSVTIDPDGTIAESNEGNNTATASTTVNAAALPDLTVTKTDSPDPVAVGGTLTYTITASNAAGGASASGIKLTDTLPAGFTVTNTNVGSVGGFTARVNTSTIDFTGGTLNAGQSATLTITGTAPSTAGNITNSVTIDPDGAIAESNEGNNTATATTTVSAPAALPDLTITKTDSPDPVTTGGTLTYTITASNAAGGANASGIKIVDTLPTGFTITNTSVGSVGGFTATPSGNTVTFTNGSLNAGQSATLTITGTAPSTAGNITNSVTIDPDGTIAESDETNNTATALTAVNAPAATPDLTVTKTDSPDPVTAGGTLVYKVTVSNAASGSQVTGVALRDTLPTGFKVTNIDSAGFKSVISNNIIDFTGGTLNAGQSAVLTITGTAPSTTGSITNTVKVDPDNKITETNEENNTATATTNVIAASSSSSSSSSSQPDLSVSTTATPNNVSPGGTLTYNITLSNTTGAANASGIKITDTLPAGFTLTSTDVGSTGFTVSQSGNIVTFSGGSLNAGQSATLAITGTVPNSSATLTNIVNVDPDNSISESNENNNTSTLSTNVGTGTRSNDALVIAFPTTNATDSGSPTGAKPTNGSDGVFYNLTDGADNVNLANIPQASGLVVRGLSGHDVIQGSANTDNVNGNAGMDTIFGNGGNDILRGGKGSDSLDGGNGNDVLNGNNGNDTVLGGEGDDTVRGGRGSDFLVGGNGNDVLIGDLGQDFLTGNNGSDTFVLRAGEAVAPDLASADVIIDFNLSEDKIGLTDGVQFNQLVFEPIKLVLGNSTQTNSTAIRIGTNGSYIGIVQGVTPDAFKSSLFIDAANLLGVG